MQESAIKKIYSKKIQEYKKNSKFYYVDSNPKISDSEFDILKKEILDLEVKYLFLKSKDSPSNSIGHKPSKNFEKVKHKIPMLSLSNAFNEEDLVNFEKKILNFLKLSIDKDIEYLMSQS